MSARSDVLTGGLVLWGAYLALDTGSQLAFKWAAGSVGAGALDLRWLRRALMAPGLWVGIACYVGTLLIWLRVLARSDLSRAFPMSGLSYITVPVFAIVLFGESLNVTEATGIAAICAGVALLATERSSGESESYSPSSPEEQP
jgi:drug/metabolite transporter (DMT)-like permease